MNAPNGGASGAGNPADSTASWLPAGAVATRIVQNVRLVSVTTGEIEPCDLVLAGDRIAALWPPKSPVPTGDVPVLEGRGRFAVPGYIDSHLHIESSFTTPSAFAEAVLRRGTTTCSADAHEITNVLGRAGLGAFMDAARGLPLDIRWMVPSSVPSVPGLETTGGSMEPEDVRELLNRPDVLGLGEVMDAYGIAAGDVRMRSILRVAREQGVMLEGHAPDVTDRALTALLWEGVDSDHSKSPTELFLKKLRLGMFLELQAKTVLPDLIAAILALPMDPPFALCTDDVSADVLWDEGHLDRIARLAVAAGLPPLRALRAMTFEPARRLRLHDRGLLAPGRRADVLLLPDLETFVPDVVIAQGEIVVDEGGLTPFARQRLDDGGSATALAMLRHSLHLPEAALSPDRFRWPAPAPGPHLHLRALSLNREDNYSREEVVTASVRGGFVDLPAGVALLTVIDRHSGEGRQSFAPLLGQDLGRGALASTYSHDAHNLTVIGTDPADMSLAAHAATDMDGGMVVVEDGRVTARLALPLAGVVSDAPLANVVRDARTVRTALEHWGFHHKNPFMNVSTVGLLVSPEIRLSDRGLVQVRTRRLLSALADGD